MWTLLGISSQKHLVVVRQLPLEGEERRHHSAVDFDHITSSARQWGVWNDCAALVLFVWGLVSGLRTGKGLSCMCREPVEYDKVLEYMYLNNGQLQSVPGWCTRHYMQQFTEQWHIYLYPVLVPHNKLASIFPRTSLSWIDIDCLSSLLMFAVRWPNAVTQGSHHRPLLETRAKRIVVLPAYNIVDIQVQLCSPK